MVALRKKVVVMELLVAVQKYRDGDEAGGRTSLPELRLDNVYEGEQEERRG